MFMQIQLLKSKIHRAQVTDAHLDYEGSLTIDAGLMDRANLVPFERVLCSNINNGHRFETYVIPGSRNQNAIVLNGAAAHLGKPGDRLTIMSYTWVDETMAAAWTPRVILLGDGNAILTERGK
jgi:aspartate 1-decarboxylase